MTGKKAKTTKKPAAAKAKPAGKKEGAKREQQNGVTRPADGTLCAQVWEALDALIAQDKDTTFEAVRELAGKEMADATIRTQRQRHKVFHSKS